LGWRWTWRRSRTPDACIQIVLARVQTRRFRLFCNPTGLDVSR
jgi:hypothetical protein